jgi:hypothetical protein
MRGSEAFLLRGEKESGMPKRFLVFISDRSYEGGGAEPLSKVTMQPNEYLKNV